MTDRTGMEFSPTDAAPPPRFDARTLLVPPAAVGSAGGGSAAYRWPCPLGQSLLASVCSP